MSLLGLGAPKGSVDGCGGGPSPISHRRSLSVVLTSKNDDEEMMMTSSRHSWPMMGRRRRRKTASAYSFHTHTTFLIVSSILYAYESELLIFSVFSALRSKGRGKNNNIHHISWMNLII